MKLNALSGKHEQKVQPIFWDVDDVVLNSSETVIDIINKKFLMPNKLKEKDGTNLVDWGFKSIYRYISQEEVYKIFSSDDFWDNVKINPQFIAILNSEAIKKYRNFFITKGTQENLAKKKEFLERALGDKFLDFDYIGIDINSSKNSIDMSNGIQIDDNYKNLKDTNARLKILLKNDRETRYNNSFEKSKKDYELTEDIYYVNNLGEVLEILEFNSKVRL